MMESALSLFQLHGDWLELLLLFIGENGLNRVHVAGQARDRQEGPAMATGNVLQAAVVARGVVEPDPAR